MTTIDELTDRALAAFWEVVADQFPEAESGDLSPWAAIRLEAMAKAAIREWIANNVNTQEDDIATGYRFSLLWQVDRFPDFQAARGLTGVVIAVNDSGVWARMDQPLAGAEQWDNQIHWQTPEDFARDTVPI
jgi:hypothetical protein